MKEHKELQDELGLTFPIISDEKLKFIQEAGMKNPDEHKSLRGFVILDMNGKILDAQEVNPFGDEGENIINYAAQKVGK